MINVIEFAPREDARNISSFRREKSFWKELSLIDCDRAQSVASVRFYGAGETVYCVAWVWAGAYGPAFEASSRGYGKAGGYGYHKTSAAMAEALAQAGMKLSEDIGGRGDGVMVEALQALARHLGITRPYIHHAHG